MNTKKKIKIALFSLLFILGGIAVFISLGLTTGENKKEAAFEEVRAKKGDLKIDLTADGSVELDTVNLQFGINGTLNQILVSEGTKVKQGDILAKLDSKKYVNEVEIAQANLQEAVNDMEKIQLEYIPMKELTEAYAKIDIDSKKLDLDKSNAKIQEAQSNLRKAEDSLSDTVLKSPINGTIVQINGKVGELVSSSNNDSGKPFAIVSEDQVKVVAKVLEQDIGEVSIGQKVEVVTEAFPNEKFGGKVTKIAYLPTTDSNGIVAYLVEVQLDQPKENLRNGMTCTVSFILKEVKDVILIPNKAVSIVDGKQVVQMLSEKGDVAKREVKAGFTDGSNVEIKEGLQAGDIVLLSK
ncbi:MAG: efflux RND transporter periplasmic adaptor subunit [Peptococcaceae bacterium]|nr:efflux RND transporter periplasmic adaptor subunit [Peptococcaceae bacterium]